MLDMKLQHGTKMKERVRSKKMLRQEEYFQERETKQRDRDKR